MDETGIEPFRIASLPLDGQGMIGIARLPGRDGQLDSDIRQIRLWGAKAVLSLTEEAERAPFAAALPARLAAAGIDFHPFPIRDFGAPGGASAWPALSAILHARLDRGERLFIHCMGGKGRSGMMAMRLLVERGQEPDSALRLIRSIRPGAVETDEQEAWARAGRMPSLDDSIRRNASR